MYRRERFPATRPAILAFSFDLRVILPWVAVEARTSKFWTKSKTTLKVLGVGNNASNYVDKLEDKAEDTFRKSKASNKDPNNFVSSR